MKNKRTDLALEAREIFLAESKSKSDIDGVLVEEESFGEEIKVTRVIIKNETGEKTLSKKRGKYVTVEFPADFSGYNNLSLRLTEIIKDEIEKILAGKIPENTLVIGLGNRNITADALGPKVVEGVLATRHLKEYMPDEIDERLSSVSAVAPGVLGRTGIETGEIVKGICEKVSPKLVIAIDALCSRKIDRINSTVQISNTGIQPGAGVGNKRMTIDEGTLGVPVIVLGVPTVVDAATLAEDTIELIVGGLKAGAKENLPLYKMLSVIEKEDNLPIIKEVLSSAEQNFVVTPKEIDESIGRLSGVIANSINLCLHKGLTLADLELYKV